MAPLVPLTLWLSCLAALTIAIPTFEHLSGWGQNIGSLVPGASYIEAIGKSHDSFHRARHLNVHAPGFPGNITVAAHTRRPQLFYIHQHQLWQMVNETTIYPVNVMKATATSDGPLQLVSAKKRQGNPHGAWRWQGTMLFYEEGKMSNGGLYYECDIKDSLPGVFTFLKGVKPPEGCSPMTLHGFNRQFIDQSRGR